MTEEQVLAWLCGARPWRRRTDRLDLPRMARVLYLRYGEGRSWKEMGVRVGASRVRAHQIADDGLHLLRQHPRTWLLDAVAVLPRNHRLFGAVCGGIDPLEVAEWVAANLRLVR